MHRPTLWQRLIRWLQATPRPKQRHTSAEGKGSHAREASRQQRAQQRDKLHAIVRENMIRTGVLSGAYKFKTLPLDRVGQSFIVLFDIDATAMASDAHALTAWEHSLQALVQERLHMEVKSVYWRVHNAPEVTKPGAAVPASHPPGVHWRDFAPTQPADHDPVRDGMRPSATQPGRLE